MNTPTPRELLDVWEWGQPRSPTRRALALLAAGCPERPPAALRALSLGRRDRLLLALRERLFGPDLEAVEDCPGCGETVEVALDARLLAEGLADPDAPEPDPPAVEVEGVAIRWRRPASADLIAVESEPDPSGARDALVLATILEARRDGQPIDPATLPASVLDAYAAAIDRVEPGLRVELGLTCPSCGRRWLAGFDAGSFLWAEVERHSVRLLADAHALATAYGWGEREIFALSAARRASYLELIGG